MTFGVGPPPQAMPVQGPPARLGFYGGLPPPPSAYGGLAPVFYGGGLPPPSVHGVGSSPPAAYCGGLTMPAALGVGMAAAYGDPFWFAGGPPYACPTQHASDGLQRIAPRATNGTFSVFIMYLPSLLWARFFFSVWFSFGSMSSARCRVLFSHAHLVLRFFLFRACRIGLTSRDCRTEPNPTGTTVDSQPASPPTAAAPDPTPAAAAAAPADCVAL